MVTWFALTLGMVAGGGWLEHHHHVLGIAAIAWGTLWAIGTWKFGHDEEYLRELARTRLPLRRFSIGWRRLSDAERIERDARSQGRLVRIFPIFGLLMIGAGVLWFIKGIPTS